MPLSLSLSLWSISSTGHTCLKKAGGLSSEYF
jgi:hypothetical protein